MKLKYPSRVQRIWPLALSALALWGIVRTTPALHRNFELAHDGVNTYGCYTDLNQDDDFIQYSYVVGDVTYSGRISWADTDSDIYSRKPGDKVSVNINGAVLA